MSKKRGSAFYLTEEFRKLNELWVTGKNSKLKKSGFEDAEYHWGLLKSKNKRTAGYLEQETLQRISSALMFYVEHSPYRLKRHEKRILSLHARGVYQIEIAEIVKRTVQTVGSIVKKHIPFALGLYAQEERLAQEEVESLPIGIEIEPFFEE